MPYIGGQSPDSQVGTSAAYRSQSYTATASQTTFTVDGGYTPGYIDVYVNGIKQVNGVDVTATNGSTIVFASALSSGYTVEVQALRNIALNATSLPVSSLVFADGTTLNSAWGSVTYFQYTGNGTTVSYSTSPYTASSVNYTTVYISGVYQRKNTYSWSGTTLTFTSAPPNGAAIEIVINYQTSQVGLPSAGTVSPVMLSTGAPSWSATGNSIIIPAGATADRPSSPSNGMMRYNTTTSRFEFYQNGSWINNLSNFSVDYLVVGGGGGGGSDGGGGGGAGGYLTGSTSIISGTTYTITVGSGGSATANGSNSSITGTLSINALGGGAGGSGGGNGRTGGSGGGGGRGVGPYTGGSGTSGQGSNGGNGFSHVNGAGGGGGGASAVGANATNTDQFAGNGGAGSYSSISGANTAYAGGGGGGAGNVGSSNATGGAGGGGAGGGATGTAGTTNTGGGGGGGQQGGTGGAGGSGVVIISIPTIYYTGTTTGSPTVTTNGSNTIIKFTSSGSYTA